MARRRRLSIYSSVSVVATLSTLTKQRHCWSDGGRRTTSTASLRGLLVLKVSVGRTTACPCRKPAAAVSGYPLDRSDLPNAVHCIASPTEASGRTRCEILSPKRNCPLWWKQGCEDCCELRYGERFDEY